MRGARGVDHPIPVVFGKKILGYAYGERGGRVVHWFGYTGIDDVVSSMIRDGKFLNRSFSKAYTTAALAIWNDYWPVGGYPQAGVYAGAAKTAVQFNNSVAGGIWVGGDVSPETKHLFTVSAMNDSNLTTLWLLYDRVLAYEACTLVNGSQNMTNVLAAQRYASDGQSGMRIMCTVQTTLGGAANLTVVTYTDQSGNSGATVPGATMSFDTAPTTPGTNLAAGCCIIVANQNVLFLPLATGDSGVRSIQNYTCSANQTGTFVFVLARPLAYIPTSGNLALASYDLARQQVNLERLYDGAHLALAGNLSSNTDINTFGNIVVGWS